MKLFAYSSNFKSSRFAYDWAKRQLPLVKKHGARLYVVKTGDLFIVYRSECPRDRDKSILRENGLFSSISMYEWGKSRGDEFIVNMKDIHVVRVVK